MIYYDRLLRCTSEEPEQGRYIYKYTDIFAEIADDKKRAVLSALEELKSVIPEVIIPKWKAAGSVHSFEYPIKKENCTLLISTYSKKKIDGPPVTFGLKVKIAERLCELFARLYENNFYLENFSEQFVLYEQSSGRVYFDLLPAILPMLQAAAEALKIAEPDYYFATRAQARKTVQPAPRKQTKRLIWPFQPTEKKQSPEVSSAPDYFDDAKNRINYFLSLTMFKLFVSPTVYQWATTGDMERQRADQEVLLVKSTSSLFPEKFYDSLKALCLSEDNSGSDYAFFAPNKWKDCLALFVCKCGQGIFVSYNGAVVCPACGKQYIGSARLDSVDKKIHLLAHNAVNYIPPGEQPTKNLVTYSLRDFGGTDEKNSDYFFKLQCKLDAENGMQIGFAFPNDSEVELVENEKREAVTETTASGMVLLKLFPRKLHNNTFTIVFNKKFELHVELLPNISK
jgi:hypothetical protein